MNSVGITFTQVNSVGITFTQVNSVGITFTQVSSVPKQVVCQLPVHFELHFDRVVVFLFERPHDHLKDRVRVLGNSLGPPDEQPLDRQMLDETEHHVAD